MTRIWPRHEQDEIDAVTAVLRSGATNYYTGTDGASFEREWASYVGVPHALTCSNGTTALELALSACLEGGRGWEVIVPSRTFVATASAVVTAGGTPVLADIDRETLNVTAETLEARRTPLTRGVVVVHYAGLPARMVEIVEWARSRRLFVVEDCAHAHGARIDGRSVGTFGDVGCWSMCVGKIMSTGGEGGMVVTANARLARLMAQRRDHGRFQMAGSPETRGFMYTVDVPGSNARQTEMQSAIGRRQLLKLDGWVRRRREIAAVYDVAFGVPPRVESVRYMYLMRVTAEQKERLLADDRAWAAGVRYGGCGNIGRERAFAGSAACPEGDASDAEVVMLPVYPTRDDAAVAEVVEAVKVVLG